MPNSLSVSSMASTAFCGAGFSTMLNRPDAPVKSRFQIAWPGSVSSAGMQHARDLGSGREPARHVEPRAMMLRQPHRERAQAAQREEDVIRAGTDAEQADAFGDLRPSLGIGRDGAEHDVGMAADIFGGGLHADVDALFERAVIERRRPGVVVDDERAARMRDLGDGADVGHLERLRAGRLDQHRAVFGLNSLSMPAPIIGSK